MSSQRPKLLAAACFTMIMYVNCQGCGKSSPSLQADDQRIESIVTKSSGDWNNVSAADRDYFTKELANGNEQSGKMLFLARWGRIKGGPPEPGAAH